MAGDDVDEVPAPVLARLRAICLYLPEVDEEPAWLGVRWRVRRRTFAHVFVVHDGTSPAMARATAGAPGTALVFRSRGPELEVLQHSGPPFVPVAWGRDAIAMHLGDHPDWEEVRELVTESYCTMAPKVLQSLVDRPGG